MSEKQFFVLDLKIDFTTAQEYNFIINCRSHGMLEAKVLEAPSGIKIESDWADPYGTFKQQPYLYSIWYLSDQTSLKGNGARCIGGSWQNMQWPVISELAKALYDSHQNMISCITDRPEFFLRKAIYDPKPEDKAFTPYHVLNGRRHQSMGVSVYGKKSGSLAPVQCVVNW